MMLSAPFIEDIEMRFGAISEATPLKEARAWRLDIEGEPAFLKRYAKHQAKCAQTEHALLRILLSASYRFACYPVEDRAGQTLHQLDTGDECCSWALFPWVAGDLLPGKDGGGIVEPVIEGVAELIRTLCGIGASSTGLASGQWGPDSSILRHRLDRLGLVGPAEEDCIRFLMTVVLPMLCADENEQPEHWNWVHGDLKPENLVRVQGRPVFIDWESAHLARPGYDAAYFVIHALGTKCGAYAAYEDLRLRVGDERIPPDPAPLWIAIYAQQIALQLVNGSCFEGDPFLSAAWQALVQLVETSHWKE